MVEIGNKSIECKSMDAIKERSSRKIQPTFHLENITESDSEEEEETETETEEEEETETETETEMESLPSSISISINININININKNLQGNQVMNCKPQLVRRLSWISAPTLPTIEEMDESEPKKRKRSHTLPGAFKTFKSLSLKVMKKPMSTSSIFN